MMLFLILFTGPIYGLLVLYAARSYRRIQPRVRFTEQLPILMPDIWVSAIAWLVLMFVLLILANLTSPGSTTSQSTQEALIFQAVTFIPFLPAYGGMLLAGSLIFLGLPQDASFLGPLIMVGAVLSVLALLLLISYLEWHLLRWRQRDSAL